MNNNDTVAITLMVFYGVLIILILYGLGGLSADNKNLQIRVGEIEEILTGEAK